MTNSVATALCPITHFAGQRARWKWPAGVAALVLAANSFAATTVGVIDPTPQGQTIQDSPNNVGNANFITRSAMDTLMATAFANDTGGVINFDSANGWVGNVNASSFAVTYGTSQTNTLTLSRTDGGGTNTFGPSSGAGTTQTSGDLYVGFQNSGSPIEFTFSQGLSAWGITQLNRFASRDVTMSFTLADSTVINYATQNQDPNNDNTGALNWYGFQASNANPLTKVTITSNGFVRYDDLAVVVAPPVPEPSTAMVLMGGVGMLALLRRRKTVHRG